MPRFKFSKWLNHPVYFFFWFFIGLFIWSFNFYFSPISQPVQVNQLSSVQEEILGLNETNYDELKSSTDDQLLYQLEHLQTESPATNVTSEVSGAVERQGYEMTAEEIQNYEERLAQSSHKKNKNEFEYEQISEDGVLTNFENEKSCNGNRLLYEKQILANPKLKDLYSAHQVESKQLPQKCLTHVMNKAAFAGSNYAICSKSSGPAKIPGAKPCITENLVNITYNSFSDVTECLNLNPKLLLPKIYNESGFLINTYGAGKDGGIGQLTQVAIDEVNKVYDKYMAEIEKAAASKPSCARVIKFKSLLGKAPSAPQQRCAFIGLPENPLRNVLYMAILNRMNMDHLSGINYVAGEDFFVRGSQFVPVHNDSKDEFDGLFKGKKFKESLIELGIKNPNMHFFKEVLTIAGYNMGTPTATRVFAEYLEKRKTAKKPLTADDFDFNKTKVAKDVLGDGSDKNVVAIARSFIMSSFIGRKDTAAVKAIKVRKRKELPRVWASAYLKTFPEFLALKANAYDGKKISTYTIYGFPGYVNVVAEKNQLLRDTFNSAGIDPNYCSDPNFLKLQ